MLNYFNIVAWQKIQLPSTYKQEPASDSYWEIFFTYNRKQSTPRIEPCGTPCFNVPASEASIKTNQKFMFERQE